VGEVVLVVVAQVVVQVVHYSQFPLVVEVVEEYSLHNQKSWCYWGWT
jgi:hypothetical protein